MPAITINAEPKTLPDPLTVEKLLLILGKDPKKLAVEVNRFVVPRSEHKNCLLGNGDAVEIVTLVGGG
jgi:thiamine biosynthesis protein ThiS